MWIETNKAAVLRSSVETGKKGDWILEQVDRGIDVLICNPELVKTGLDLLDFPAVCSLRVVSTATAALGIPRVG